MNRCFWPLALAILVIGCDSQPGGKLADEAAIDLFKRLALPVIGLRFPNSRDHLETCRRVRDEHCVGAYDSFMAARDELRALPRHDALELTLAWLAGSCGEEQSAELGFVCVGAVIALTFFPEKPEDRRIRQFLSQLPPAQRDRLIDRSSNSGPSWLDNRADRKAWRSWLESHIEDQAVRARSIARLDAADARSDGRYQFILNSGEP